ncbi:MAG: TadE/TadG family type IV pilus assembly protein [Thermoguttaceae bacterium]
MPYSQRRRARRAARKGAAVVEMAFVAPLLFVFVLGLIEVGRIYWVQKTLRNACQDGVRYGAIRGVEVDDVIGLVRERLMGSIDPDLCTIIVRDASVYDTSGPYPHEQHVADGFISLPEFDNDNPLSEQDPGSMIVVRAAVPYEDITYLPLGALSRMLAVASRSPQQEVFEGLTFSCYTFARHE